MIRARQLLRWVLGGLAWVLRVGVLLIILRYSSYSLSEPWNVAGILARDALFDYIEWEVGALAAKVESTVYGVHPFMSEEARSAFVRAYMNDLAHARDLEGQINTLYADPNVGDPAQASATLRTERDALRATVRSRQTLTEAILEGQVASVLTAQGFGVGGQLLPPIAMRFTEVPNLLIVSPRDQIRFDISINLLALPVDEQEALEAQIDDRLEASSLIVPLGGIALFPAMILETTNIQYAVEVFAHEWLHHYLFAFPLGLDYDFASETRIINETTANLFGKAIAPLVLRRYYPDLAPPEVTPPTAIPLGTPTPMPATPTPDPRLTPTATPFSYGAAMNETRITVDDLLAAGQVDQAEAYMEARRRFFAENGYFIRKLNQAFFAFYGGYQGESRAEGGRDPIGPAVATVRDQSPSLLAWIETMRGVTTREALLAACGCADAVAP